MSYRQLFYGFRKLKEGFEPGTPIIGSKKAKEISIRMQETPGMRIQVRILCYK
jgi:hypothetical protein